MKNFFLVCVAILLLFSCKQTATQSDTKQDTPTSPNLTSGEQKALQLTATSLSGEVTGALTPDGKALEITISNSVTLEQEADLLPLHASRAAWVFYKNSGEEKPAYDKIIVKTQLMDTTFSLAYTLQDLAIVKARLPAFEAVGTLLVSGDYDGLYALFDPTVMGAVKVEGLKDYLEQISTQYGKPLAFEFRGFSFNKTSSGKDFLSLAGPLRREIEDTALDIAIDLSKPPMKGSLSSIKFDY